MDYSVITCGQRYIRSEARGCSREGAEAIAMRHTPPNPDWYTSVIGPAGNTVCHYRRINGKIQRFDHQGNHLSHRDELALIASAPEWSAEDNTFTV